MALLMGVYWERPRVVPLLPAVLMALLLLLVLVLVRMLLVLAARATGI